MDTINIIEVQLRLVFLLGGAAKLAGASPRHPTSAKRNMPQNDSLTLRGEEACCLKAALVCEKLGRAERFRGQAPPRENKKQNTHQTTPEATGKMTKNTTHTTIPISCSLRATFSAPVCFAFQQGLSREIRTHWGNTNHVSLGDRCFQALPDIFRLFCFSTRTDLSIRVFPMRFRYMPDVIPDSGFPHRAC